MLWWGLCSSLVACAAPTPEAQAPTPVVVEVAAPATAEPLAGEQPPAELAGDEPTDDAHEDPAAAEPSEDGEDVHAARKRAMEEAKAAGILGVLKTQPGGMTGVFGGGAGLGSGTASALGGLKGTSVGDAFGAGGLGLSGVGRGGGGTGGGTIGLGRVGTIGRGGGGKGYGSGSGRFGRLGTGKRVRVKSGSATVDQDGLSKEVIQRVIRRQLGRMRYCYERELAKDPKLAGRVVVDFVIDKQGKVVHASTRSSTLASRSVETCLVRSFRAMIFPKPKKNIVKVSYPLVFSAGDSNATTKKPVALPKRRGTAKKPSKP
jgi:hypothetical protein